MNILNIHQSRQSRLIEILYKIKSVKLPLMAQELCLISSADILLHPAAHELIEKSKTITMKYNEHISE